MITPELLSYIRSEKAWGVSDEKIKAAVISQGWNAGDYEEATIELSKPPAEQKKMPVSPEIKEYRRRMTWTVFGLLMIVPVVFSFSMFGSAFSSPSASWSGLAPTLIMYLVAIVLGGYLSARFVASAVKPSDETWKEVLKVIGLTFLGYILFIFIGGVIFFVTCLFLVSTGGGLGGL